MRICKSNRRRFLKGMTVSAAAMAVASPWRRLLAAASGRALSFYHTHTGERLHTVYYHDGRYLTDELHEVNGFLKDFRTGEVHPIDPKVLDILYAVQQITGSRGTFEVISGFRSPRTNTELRRQGRGVAQWSLHMVGKAIDVRLTDVPTAALRKAAIATRSGGVGYYPKPDFIHVDTGRVRAW